MTWFERMDRAGWRFYNWGSGIWYRHRDEYNASLTRPEIDAYKERDEVPDCYDVPSFKEWRATLKPAHVAAPSVVSGASGEKEGKDG